MGRRSKAEALGLVSKIIELYEKRHMTHEEIAEYLQTHDGVDLSREAVRRAYNKADAKAEKYKLAAESARSIIEAAKGSNIELAEAANSMISSMFYEKILEKESLEFKDDSSFFKAMAPVMKNQAELVKARLSFDNGREKALEQVWDELSELLKGDQELLLKLQKKIETIRGNNE